MAFPRPALTVDDVVAQRIAEVVREEMVDLVVIGRPVALSGNETQSTESADALYRAVVETLEDVEVIQWDERLTTRQAQRSLTGAGVKAKQQRALIDSAAAVIMLQHYLDGLRAH